MPRAKRGFKARRRRNRILAHSKGFYGQLVKGKVPSWLQPVELPKESPFKMWKVVG